MDGPYPLVRCPKFWTGDGYQTVDRWYTEDEPTMIDSESESEEDILIEGDGNE